MISSRALWALAASVALLALAVLLTNRYTIVQTGDSAYRLDGLPGSVRFYDAGAWYPAERIRP